MGKDLISRKALLDALEAGKNKVYEGKTILEVMKEIVEEQPGIEMQEAKAVAGYSKITRRKAWL